MPKSQSTEKLGLVTIVIEDSPFLAKEEMDSKLDPNDGTTNTFSFYSNWSFMNFHSFTASTLSSASACEKKVFQKYSLSKFQKRVFQPRFVIAQVGICRLHELQQKILYEQMSFIYLENAGLTKIFIGSHKE